MRIIFHHPLPLDANAKSASGIRPLCMLKAFQDLGYEVDLVTGYAQERKEAINRIKSNLKQGVKYDFVYAESSTMPTTLTERHHLPTHPFLDFNFFLLCKKNSIPIGLFYRDIFWRFPEYGQGMSTIKRIVAKLAYRFDLFVYRKSLARLYLPSMNMAEYIPFTRFKKIEALPPGHNGEVASSPTYKAEKSLKLFYVGGMSHLYQMHKVFSVIGKIPEVEFIVCTREKEWQSVKSQYPEPTPNIKIIHEFGVAMSKYLNDCDIAFFCIKPHVYAEFGAPVKIYEYLGARKPILCSEGTLAGRFVSDHGVGWSVRYDENELEKKLKLLLENRELIEKVKVQLDIVAPQHSWQERARQVIKGLSQ